MVSALLACIVVLFAVETSASSHSEAPGTAKNPSADVSDFYMFTSYEDGRKDYVTFVMNVHPMQNPFAGPNYFAFSDDHFFEINVDNNGDAVEDMTFQFYFGNRLGGVKTIVRKDHDIDDCSDVVYDKVIHQGLTLPIGTGANQKNIPVPLKTLGPVTDDDSTLNWFETYQMNFVQGSRTSNRVHVVSAEGSPGQVVFNKPFDYAGEKTFGNARAYEAYARKHIYDINIPECGVGRVFAGQRKESFHVSLGQIFDLINLNPLTKNECDIKNNDLRNINVGSIVLEVPKTCLGGNVIGAWTTVRKLDHQGEQHVPTLQVSRLGNPLVNELVIGLLDKDVFSQAEPKNDGQFADYVTHPTLPAIIDILFRDAVKSPSNIAPSNIPRLDLVTAFLTGVPGLNKLPAPPGRAEPVASEYLRLNLQIPPVNKFEQNNMGVIEGDNAGFPNGRRPGDDVVDIALRVMMGKLCHLGLGVCNPTDAPVGTAPFTDGSPQSAYNFDAVFPYLRTPNPGATNAAGSSTTCETPASCPDACSACQNPCLSCQSGDKGCDPPKCETCETCETCEVCGGAQLQTMLAICVALFASFFFY